MQAALKSAIVFLALMGLASAHAAVRVITGPTHVDFPLRSGRATWYSLMVEDNDGRRAHTNPIWVDVTTPARR